MISDRYKCKPYWLLDDDSHEIYVEGAAQDIGRNHLVYLIAVTFKVHTYFFIVSIIAQ